MLKATYYLKKGLKNSFMALDLQKKIAKTGQKWKILSNFARKRNMSYF